LDSVTHKFPDGNFARLSVKLAGLAFSHGSAILLRIKLLPPLRVAEKALLFRQATLTRLA